MIVSCLASPRQPRPSPARPGLQFAARRFIDERLHESLLPAEICCALRCSRSALYRAFEPIGGIAEFIRDRRLDAAYVLLSETGAPRVGEIAERKRFADATAFAKAFRRRLGVSPREARRRLERAPFGAGMFERWARPLASADREASAA